MTTQHDARTALKIGRAAAAIENAYDSIRSARAILAETDLGQELEEPMMMAYKILQRVAKTIVEREGDVGKETP